MSVNDKRAVKIWNDSVILADGHYQLDIPFKADPPNLPENKVIAERRLKSLAGRLTRDPKLHSRYRTEIENLLSRGFAEKVSDLEMESSPGLTLYLITVSLTLTNMTSLELSLTVWQGLVMLR